MLDVLGGPSKGTRGVADIPSGVIKRCTQEVPEAALLRSRLDDHETGTRENDASL